MRNEFQKKLRFGFRLPMRIEDLKIENQERFGKKRECSSISGTTGIRKEGNSRPKSITQKLFIYRLENLTTELYSYICNIQARTIFFYYSISVYKRPGFKITFYRKLGQTLIINVRCTLKLLSLWILLPARKGLKWVCPSYIEGLYGVPRENKVPRSSIVLITWKRHVKSW